MASAFTAGWTCATFDQVWKKAFPLDPPPLQVMSREEQATLERFRADTSPDKSRYQFGGEPVGAAEVFDRPLLCFHDARVVAAYKLQIERILKTPGVRGVAFDFFGYQNYRSCCCPLSRRLLKAYGEKHPELSPQEAEDRFSLETLVDFYNVLSAHARGFRPDAKVITHVYPVYRKEPLYGNRLDVDVCAQTAAWFFEPYWSEDKIRAYSRIIARDANKYYPRPQGAALIGYYATPHGKSKERLTRELQAILDGGCLRVHVCSLEHVVNNPEASAVFRSFFGKQ